MTSTSPSGTFVRHSACTSPSCKSSDALVIRRREDGTHYGKCYSCGHYDENPPLDGPMPAPRRGELSSMLSLDDLLECPTSSIPSREISQQTAEFYEVRTILNGTDGRTPVALVFPYYKYIYNNNINTNKIKLSGFKKRILSDKIFTSIGDTKETLLFGQDKFLEGGKKLFITEGEIDCLSLFQVLKETSSPEFKHLNPCVVSVPHGAKSAAQAISNNKSFVDKFQEIVLVFDQDEPGQEAVEQICAFLPPSKVKVASFSEKDPNDMLKANKLSELRWAVLSNAKIYEPQGITSSQKLLTEALRAPQRGIDWPWPTLNQISYGIKPGLYGIGAGVGIGKTEFFHELLYWITYESGKSAAGFLLEENPIRTLRVLGGRVLNRPAHKPDSGVSEEELREAILKFSDPTELLYLFDHKGSTEWEHIFSQAKFLASVHGVRYMVIDPLTAILAHTESTDRALHSIVSDMAVLTKPPYDCAVFYSSHLNEPPRERTSHEEGGRVREADLTGSRAMIRFSDHIFGLERNKQDPDIVKRNTTTFRWLKDRETGEGTGKTFEIYYDHDQGTYREPQFGF